MREKEICSKWKSKIKSKEKYLNEMKISNLSDKEFKVMVIKMLRSIWPWEKNEHWENFNKDGNIKKYQTEVTELKNTELKNTLEVFNSRLDKTEERTGD